MRRLALSMLASCGLTMLAACSGGTGLGGGNTTNPSISGVYFTNGSAQVNDFFLAPSGNAPIEVNAVAYKGSGVSNNVVPNVNFTWQAAFAPSGTPYYKGTSPNGQGSCGAPGQTPAVTSLLQQGTAGQPYGPTYTSFYSGGYSQLADQNNPVPATPNYVTNPPIYISQTDHIFVAPPLAPTAAGTESSTPVSGSNYCLRLVATAVGSGVQGSILIVVSNSP